MKQQQHLFVTAREVGKALAELLHRDDAKGVSLFQSIDLWNYLVEVLLADDHLVSAAV